VKQQLPGRWAIPHIRVTPDRALPGSSRFRSRIHHSWGSVFGPLNWTWFGAISTWSPYRVWHGPTSYNQPPN